MFLFIDSRYVASKVILRPRFVCHSAIILEIIVYMIYVWFSIKNKDMNPSKFKD